jgi:uncharacterized lipoprotein NlpE involved in copper resistance
MKKIFLVLSVWCVLTFVACNNNSDHHTDPGTGKMNEDFTMTAPNDSGSTVNVSSPSDSAPENSKGKGAPPGSDNPRKVDIGGQSHPMDTASKGK